ncbi:MAG: SGNH/GDSL hydrolase family protein [Gemmatimonadota bacterium]
MKFRTIAASLALILPALAACHSDDSLNPPPAPDVPSGGAMFQRYVSMGNSITAGFQSAGINDSTQSRSYAVLLSKAMGTTFVYPSLNRPGCPPPFINNVTQRRDSLPGIPGPITGSSCFLRAGNVLPNNVAVPGARATEILTNFGVPASASNALTLLFLGGRNQLQAMQEQDPTFVSLWIGNNDVLGSLTSLSNPGNPLLVTPVNTFQTQYTEILDSIQAEGASAVLISVADVSVIPYASSGSTYWCIKNQPACGVFPAAFPAGFTVNSNCAPLASGIPGATGDSVLVPWPIGVPRIAAAAAGASTTLDCSVDADVVLPSEYATLRNAVTGYNAIIQSEATARGFAFMDINVPLTAAVMAGQIPPFPDLSQALSGGNVGFGPLFSLDGVHPSTTAHRLIADNVADAINTTYSTALPVPVCGTVTCPVPTPPILAKSRH